MTHIILKEEVSKIAGAAMEVYYQLGTGFLEPVYQESLQIEFSHRRIPFDAQKRLEVFYKDIKLTKKYIPDFVCFGQIIVELKVMDRLRFIESAQVINYLKITKIRVGLLINFGSHARLERQRFVV